MKINVSNIVSDKDLSLVAARHLEYSLREISSYNELTNEEKSIISPDVFDSIKDNSQAAKFEELKAKYPNVILFMRIGDMYECREKDAEDSARILGITLSKHTVSQQLYAAFPVSAFDTYVPKLIRAGHKVAIMDQFA